MDEQNLKLTFKKFFFSYLFLVSATVFLPSRQALFSIIFFIAAIEFFHLKNKFGKVFIQFILFVTTLFILQTVFFERFSFSSSVRLYMNILLPYFLIRILGINYIKYYIKIIYVIAIISFLFYFPSLISSQFHEMIGRIAPYLGTDVYLDNQNFLIFTWEEKTDFILRNSGNFTEPGYFACMLNLALAFNIIHENKLLSKKNVIFIIAIITTFSTAGYIALFFIITLQYLFVIQKGYKYLLIPLMLFLSYQAFIRLDFLQNKVTNQFQSQVEEGAQVGRFGSAMMDIKEIVKYPIIGRGLTKATRFDEVEFWEGDNAPRPILNSITDTLLKFGILGFLFYLALLIGSLRKYLKLFKLTPQSIFIVLGTIFISAFSQPILLTPIFLSLIYFKDLPSINIIKK